MIHFIVPVINNPSLVTMFLTDLTSHCSNYGSYRVVFVDNASDEPTERMLKLLAKHFDCVDLVRNPENFGFGPANNIGAEQYGMVSDVLVFTQTDVRFHGDPIPLIQEAKQGELYGARLLDGDTGWNTFGTVTVSYLEGWFLSCTKETWDRLGGFDPRYVPADFEDVDLCYNSVHKGVVLVEKPFPVSHNNMGASGWQQFQVKGMNREAVTIRNRELFAAKWSL